MSAVVINPIIFVREAHGELPKFAVVIPWPDGEADVLFLDAMGELTTASGQLAAELARLSVLGFTEILDANIPQKLAAAVQDYLGDDEHDRQSHYHHGPTWSAHAEKPSRKGTERPPTSGSERAWVGRAWPSSSERKSPQKHSYLDYVRFMRWYARRSYLYRKVSGWKYDPHKPEFFVKWPRWIP